MKTDIAADGLAQRALMESRGPETRELVLNLGRVKAHRWWKNGDHPDDYYVNEERGEEAKAKKWEGRIVRYFRRSDGGRFCERCAKHFEAHGWIDSGGAGRVVCPGDWIVTTFAGINLPIPDEVVRIVADFPIGVVISAAKETARAIDEKLAEHTGSVGCIVQGLARAAAAALEEADALTDGIEEEVRRAP